MSKSKRAPFRPKNPARPLWEVFSAAQVDEMRLGFYSVRVPEEDPQATPTHYDLMLFGYVEDDSVYDWPSRTVKFPIGDVSHFCFVDLPEHKEVR